MQQRPIRRNHSFWAPIPKHVQERIDRANADINRDCDVCGYEMASHTPLSRLANRKPALRCPSHLPPR